MPNHPYRSVSGEVLYLHDERGQVGHEQFTITEDLDQNRTLRAICEIYEERLLRDVTYTVDQNWIPQDAFVRLSMHGRFLGSSWFKFSGHVIECENFTKDAGRSSQKQILDGPLQSFGAHPVSNDAWGCSIFDMNDSSKKQHFSNVATTSKTAHGNTGPSIMLTEKYLSFHGVEQVSVPAGTFDANYYQISWDGREDMKNWPPIHIWTTGDDFIIVKIRWDHLKSDYVLNKLNLSSDKKI